MVDQETGGYGSGNVPPGTGGTPAPPAAKGKSHKSVYIIGIIIVIAIVAVTTFYLMSIMPAEPPESAEKCGNAVCDSGESYQTCPTDCEEPEPPPSFSGPASLSVSPASKSVTNGDTFTVDVTVTNASELFGFQFDVEYDSSVLELEEATEGTFLSNNGIDSTFCVPYKTPDGIAENIACTRLGSGSVNGDGLLETVTFKAIGAGTSEIKLSNVKLANPKAERIDSSASNGEVIVS